MNRIFFILLLSLIQLEISAQRRQDIRFDIDTNRAIFTGYDNRLTVKSGSTVSSESVSISKKNDTTFILMASISMTGKNIEITVTHNGKKKTRSFRCKRLPTPLFYIGNISVHDKDKISADKLSKGIVDGFWLGITGDGSEFNDNYDIKSLTVTITKGGKSKEFQIIGEAATQELKTAFANLKGAKIKISNIMVGGTAGSMYAGSFEIEAI